MKCLNQNCDANEIEKDDNFCYKCGHWTTRGYSFLKDKDNVNKIINGATIKQSNRLSTLFSLLAFSFIFFMILLMIRGNDLFKPFFYLKKQAFNYIYGYNTSLMKTDNKYSRKNIKTYEDAITFIKNDFNKQDFYCFNSIDVKLMAKELGDNYSIPSVSFCDMSTDEAKKIKSVIEKMYSLFPNVKGSLTNITITNALSKSEYIARFQPMYQFVNINEDIYDYYKVNKTQILLNSYYFLNEDMLLEPIENFVGEDWYVNDATWESTIAHEFGHYISFFTLLKKNEMNNIVLVTADNKDKIDNMMSEFNSGSYSNSLLIEALNNYNSKYNLNLSVDEFANSISKYAGSKDSNDNLIADETIAEAIHDYYLHGDNMKPESKEIVSIIKTRL